MEKKYPVNYVIVSSDEEFRNFLHVSDGMYAYPFPQPSENSMITPELFEQLFKNTLHVNQNIAAKNGNFDLFLMDHEPKANFALQQAQIFFHRINNEQRISREAKTYIENSLHQKKQIQRLQRNYNSGVTIKQNPGYSIIKF